MDTAILTHKPDKVTSERFNLALTSLLDQAHAREEHHRFHGRRATSGTLAVRHFLAARNARRVSRAFEALIPIGERRAA